MHPTSNQLSLASELDIELKSDAEVSELVIRIEQALGEKLLPELCRWFIVSAYRYRQRENWTHPDESDLDKELQYSLARAFLETRDGKTSLQAVLRDPRFRFTLVGFGKNRNADALILSSSTKAFRRAQQVIGQIPRLQGQGAESAADSTETAEALVVDRRARRRGYSGIDVDNLDAPLPEDPVRISTPVAEPETLMNEDDYQALEHELENAVPAEDRNFSYRSYEDKISLALGMASGLVLFLLALWVF